MCVADVAKCVAVTREVELRRFVLDNQAQFVVLPEEVADRVSYDSQVIGFGDVWVLLRREVPVGWFNEYSGLLFVA